MVKDNNGLITLQKQNAKKYFFGIYFSNCYILVQYILNKISFPVEYFGLF